jgi:hypothetical protein
MRVKLGTFARLGIESQIGTDLANAVEAAILHYTDKLASGRPPLPPPQFFGTGASPDLGTGSSIGAELEEIELALDSQTEATLRREAMRHGTDVNAVAAHSVMVYLAEVDFLSSAPSRRV